MKKLLAIVLSLTMVFALTIPAFATEEGTEETTPETNWFKLNVTQVKPEGEGDSLTYVPVVEEEVPEDTEDAEAPEDSEDAEAPEDAEDAEDAEAPEDSEDAEAPEDSEDAEAPEDSEDAEAPEDSEDTETPATSETPVIEPDYKADDKVYFKVDYYIPYEENFTLAKEGDDDFIMGFKVVNLKDVKLVASETVICVDGQCGLPTQDLAIITELYDATKMEITFTYGYSGYVIVETVVDKAIESKFDVSVTYGEGEEAYAETAGLVINEGVTEPATTEAPKPGKNGGFTFIAVALVSAIAGLGALGLRRKEN